MKVDIKKLVQLRKSNKLTINKVAILLNRARSVISNWENQKVIPSKIDLIALTQLYGSKVSEVSSYENLPASTKSLEESIVADRAAKELEQIIDEHAEIPLESIKPLKSIIVENIRLEKTNRSLRRNSNRLISILQSINSIIYIKDNNRILRKVNEKFLELLQSDYTEEDVIGSKAIDIFGRKEIEDIIPLENKVFVTGESITDKKIKIPGSAGKRHGLISIKPILDEFDKVIEIAVSIKDITDVYENIEKFNLLEEIINSLNNRIWIQYAHSMEYLFSSKGVEKIWGYTRDEVINNPNLLTSTELIEDFKKYNMHPLRDKSYLKPGKYKFRGRHKNGSLIWIEQSIYQSTYKGKTIYYGIDFDISEEQTK